MSTYTENQARLAATPAGQLAITMVPGTRWLRSDGQIVTVWMSWTPDLAGDSEAAAKKYKLGFDAMTHHTEIGVANRKLGTIRVSVADVGDWKAVA